MGGFDRLALKPKEEEYLRLNMMMVLMVLQEFGLAIWMSLV